MLMSEFGWSPREISALNLSDFNRRKGTLKNQTLSPTLFAWLTTYLEKRPPRANGLFVLVGSSGSFRRLSADLIGQMVAYSMHHSPRKGKVLA